MLPQLYQLQSDPDAIDEVDLLEGDHVDSWFDFRRTKQKWKEWLGEEAFVSYELMMQRFAVSQQESLKLMSSLDGRRLRGTEQHARLRGQTEP